MKSLAKNGKKLLFQNLFHDYRGHEILKDQTGNGEAHSALLLKGTVLLTSACSI
jgi:hypothetical protein